MGSSGVGMLGLGKNVKNTLNMSRRVSLKHTLIFCSYLEIKFPDNQKILDVKSRKTHVLALTSEGKVYGWGQNTHGQVGVRQNEEG